MKIFVVNAGSSSYKFSLFDLQDEEPAEPLWSGELDWGRKGRPLLLTAQSSGRTALERKLDDGSMEEGFQLLVNSLWEGDTQVIEGPAAIDAVGHRIVHGGAEFERPTLIDPKVKDSIQRLISLAPLHNPSGLQGIEWAEKIFPSLPQIAVFDTAFHATMPEFVKTYPIPWDWKEQGIQRYGFHGISHAYCAERAVKFLNRNPAGLKMINCHLGSGCSLCAIQDGKSVETTMGFTPLEGLMMGTRCGSIDPGILLYLLREKEISLDELEKRLNFESGLLGIGGSRDMRDLLDKRNDLREKLALQMFVHRLKSAIGALGATLEGFDVLSFTGGIGENAAEIRSETCRALGYLDVAIDTEKNQTSAPDADISLASSPVKVIVLHTREDWMIARACCELC